MPSHTNGWLNDDEDDDYIDDDDDDNGDDDDDDDDGVDGDDGIWGWMWMWIVDQESLTFFPQLKYNLMFGVWFFLATFPFI